jgi:hypothetical protein
LHNKWSYCQEKIITTRKALLGAITGEVVESKFGDREVPKWYILNMLFLRQCAVHMAGSSTTVRPEEGFSFLWRTSLGPKHEGVNPAESVAYCARYFLNQENAMWTAIETS